MTERESGMTGSISVKIREVVIAFHPRMLGYDFGPQHPLRPERLDRTMRLIRHVEPRLEVTDPGIGDINDVLLVHSPDYVESVMTLSNGSRLSSERVQAAGFLSGDNPAFVGMYEASLAYCAGSAWAARHVALGSPIAINLSGGLHHAQYSHASGFCVFNDCAIAISLLREKFNRIAYIDIDLHHGDGVQALFLDDPNVLTCSIHETGRTLYPGTGFVQETGASHTSLNVPLEPFSTGDTWLWAFEQTVLPAVEKFSPGAIVLQMGSDAHFLDPLGHLMVSAQEWSHAVGLVRDLGLPIVALGGGGYEKTTVPRLWTAATLELLRLEVSDSKLAGMEDVVPSGSFFDAELPMPRWQGKESADATVEQVRELVLSRLS